jgi:hypothetical protein
MRRLDADDADRDRPEPQLVPNGRGESLDDGGRVVPAPRMTAEAADHGRRVRRPAEPAASRTCRPRHDRGCGDHHRGRCGDSRYRQDVRVVEQGKAEQHGHVDGGQDRADDDDEDRAIHEHLQVVEPVAHHGDGDGSRDGHHCQRAEHSWWLDVPRGQCERGGDGGIDDDDRHADQNDGVLPTRHACGAAPGDDHSAEGDRRGDAADDTSRQLQTERKLGDITARVSRHQLGRLGHGDWSCDRRGGQRERADDGSDDDEERLPARRTNAPVWKQHERADEQQRPLDGRQPHGDPGGEAARRP